MAIFLTNQQNLAMIFNYGNFLCFRRTAIDFWRYRFVTLPLPSFSLSTRPPWNCIKIGQTFSRTSPFSTTTGNWATWPDVLSSTKTRAAGTGRSTARQKLPGPTSGLWGPRRQTLRRRTTGGRWAILWWPWANWSTWFTFTHLKLTFESQCPALTSWAHQTVCLRRTLFW